MPDYTLIKVFALGWILGALTLALLGGSRSSQKEKGSGNLITATLSLLPVAITWAERNARGGEGVFFAGYPVVNELGFGLIVGGVALHLAGIVTLKRQWSSSVVLSTEPKLIRTGLYRFLRNPIYTGILLTLLGFSLTLSNWIAVVVLMVPNALAFGYRVHVEEEFLKRSFGDEYQDYFRHTKRWIPFVL